LSKKVKEVTKKAPTFARNVKEMRKNTLNLTENPKKFQKIPKNAQSFLVYFTQFLQTNLSNPRCLAQKAPPKAIKFSKY